MLKTLINVLRKDWLQVALDKYLGMAGNVASMAGGMGAFGKLVVHSTDRILLEITLN